MLTYAELIKLRDKLINNEIGIELAKEQYWKDLKEGQRSWHTKDWKERKKEFIKEKCEICGSSEILTIQHKSHPKKYNEYLREIKRTYTNNYINNNSEIDKTIFTNHVLNDYDYVPKPLCPKNKFHTPRIRLRTKPKYRCQDCKYEFEKPSFISASELISIFLKDEDNNKDSAYKIVSEIEHIKISNIINKAEIYYEPSNTDTLISDDEDFNSARRSLSPFKILSIFIIISLVEVTCFTI